MADRKMVRLDDLIDAQQVAEIVGLAQRNSVPLYVRKYGLPAPVIDLGPSRPALWLRSEVERWNAARQSKR